MGKHYFHRHRFQSNLCRPREVDVSQFDGNLIAVEVAQTYNGLLSQLDPDKTAEWTVLQLQNIRTKEYKGEPYVKLTVHSEEVGKRNEELGYGRVSYIDTVATKIVVDNTNECGYRVYGWKYDPEKGRTDTTADITDEFNAKMIAMAEELEEKEKQAMEQQYTGKATDYVQGECKVIATIVCGEPIWDISDEEAYDKAMGGNALTGTDYNGYAELMQIGEEMQRQMAVVDPHKRVDVQLVQPTGMFAKPEVVIAIYDDRVSDTKAVDAFILKDKPMNNAERFWSKWTNYSPIETLYDNNSEKFNLPFTVESADGDKTHIMRLESVVDELRGDFMIAREQRHKEVQAELDAQGQAFEENLGITTFGEALLKPAELNNIIGQIKDAMIMAEDVREDMNEIQSEFGGSMTEFFENRGAYQTAVLLAVQSDPVLSGTIPENAENSPRLDVKQDIYGKDDVDRWDLGTGGYPVISDQRQYMACAEIQIPVFNENGEFVESNNTKVYFYDKDVFVEGAKTLDKAPSDHEGVVVLGAMFSQNLSVSEEQPFIAIDEHGIDRTQEMMSYLKLSEKTREIADREQNNIKGFDKEVSAQVKATEKEQTEKPKKNNMAVQGM